MPRAPRSRILGGVDVALPCRARLGLALALALALGGCLRPGPPPVLATTPAPSHVATSTAPSDPPGAEPFDPERRLGPLRRLAPQVFVARDAPRSRARPSRLRDSVIGAGGVRLDLGCTGGATLVRAKGKPLSLLAGRSLAALALAPGGRFASVVADDGAIVVVDLASGKPRAIDRRGSSHWVGDVLVVRDACDTFAIDPTDHATRALTRACGEVVGTGGGALWIAEPADGEPALTATALIAVAIDGTDERIAFDPERPRDPIVSPDAAIVCGTFRRERQDLLQCRATRGGRFERVALDVVGTPVFADDGTRLAVRLGDPAAPQHELHLVDFAERSIRKLGHVTHRRLAFLAGGMRVVAYAGAPGTVFAIDSGERIAFGAPEDDWIGIVPFPGDRDRFQALRSGAGGCAELVRIELPRDLLPRARPSGSVVIADPPPG